MPDRYAWLGVTRRRQLRDVLGLCLEAWLRDWCVRRDVFTPELDEISEALEISPDTEVWQASVGGGDLLIGIGERALGALGDGLASTNVADRSGVAAEIGRSALQDLLLVLAAHAGEAKAKAVLYKGPCPNCVTRPEFGAMILRVKMGSFDFWATMSRACVDQLCPGCGYEPSVPLSTREVSVLSTRVRLTAVLDFGSVSALELAGLTVDDVLVSERRLGHPADVSAGGEALFKARICREGGRLALVAHNSAACTEKV